MEATLQAEKREGRGKNEARRLRASGRIPAVVYGTDKNKATEIAVDPKVLLRILHSEAGVNTLIGLEGAGLAGGGKVLVKEYQLDPIDHKLLHADFYAVAMDKMLTVTVPIVLKGEPKGVKQQGGIVDFVNREIEVQCLPSDIPEHIDIDISELMLHQGIRVPSTWSRSRSRKPRRSRSRRPRRLARCRRSPRSSRRVRRTRTKRRPKRKKRNNWRLPIGECRLELSIDECRLVRAAA